MPLAINNQPVKLRRQNIFGKERKKLHSVNPKMQNSESVKSTHGQDSFAILCYVVVSTRSKDLQRCPEIALKHKETERE